MLLVPYKGAALLNTDLLGGRLNYTIDPAYSHIPAVKAGTLKALAVTGSSRLPGLPDVPTFTEAGLPNFDARMWFGVFMPGGTPRDVVQRMSGEIAQVLAMPDVRSQLLAREFTPFVSTPEQFSALLRNDMERYARIIRSANIKPE
jgi:tripartite-type tricarboxylate transporter receptor subunit TctC